MIKSTGSRRGWRGGRRIVLVAALAVMGAVIFGSTGTASASSVVCKGQVEPLNKKQPGIDAELSFQCNEELRGFAVVTNKTFDFFGTELEVFKPDGTPAQQSATLQCTGNVPGPGFGCGTPNRNTPSGCEAIGTTGTAPNQSNTFGAKCTNRIEPFDTGEVQVGFPQSPCKPTGQYAPGKDKLRIWLNVLTEPQVGAFNANFPGQENTAYTRGIFISEPFRLKNAYKCRAARPRATASPEKAAGSADVGSAAPRIW